MSTLVTVGNSTQPFIRLLNMVAASLDGLPRPVIVQHGPAPFDDRRCVCIGKLPKLDYHRHLANASLVICHAGQGALLEAAALGKAIVTVPRLAELDEHVDDHQIEFAEFFVERGWAVVPSPGETLVEAMARISMPNAAVVPDFTRLSDKVTALMREEAAALGLQGPD